MKRYRVTSLLLSFLSLWLDLGLQILNEHIGLEKGGDVYHIPHFFENGSYTTAQL